MKTFEDIVTEQLGIPKERIADNLTPADVPEWDSMNYLLFIGELEKHFRISFTMDEILQAASLGAVRALLKEKGVTL